ncbi:MAG: CHAT domain-containing protein [Thermodesulfovibrionales bacterium]|nr:CHAT domain-containing protein [Thermodesulfovibrionales bacterium]
MARQRYLISVFLILLFSGCAGLFKDIEVSSLMQKKRHHEIIAILQPEIDRKEAVSSFQLFLLSAAYYEIRDYKKMFSTADMLEKQIAGGDAAYFGADLSAFPGILRGGAYLDQGEYDKAVKAASAAYALLNRVGSRSNLFYRSQLINIAGILGVANAFLNRDEEADRWLEVLHSVDISGTTLGPEKFTALARIHMTKKQFPQALSAIQDPEAKVSGFITVFYDQTFQELPKFFILAKCLYETGKIYDAKENYDQLLKHPQIKQAGGIYWPSLLDRGRIARIDGQDKIAEALLQEAVDVIEKQRSSIMSEAGRIGYVGDKQEIYQELVALLVSGGRPAEAFEYVERSKSRALVDSLASNKEFGVSKDKEQVVSMLKELETIESEGKAIDVSSLAPEKANQRNIRSVQIKERIKTVAPELTSLVTVSIPPPTEIQSYIQSDETLIEYYYHGEDLYVFVLTKNILKAVKLDSKDILKDIEQLRKLLQDPKSTHYPEPSQRLYQRLIKPVEHLIDTRRLIIVPHGILHYLPFNALNSGSSYLIDKYSVSYLPSASVMKFLKHRKTQKKDIALIFGNPDLGDPRYDLKHAEEEVVEISKEFLQAKVLLRKDATETDFKKSANQFNYIHFATHGMFESDSPLNSGLFLSKDAENDGLLSVNELYSLSLNADLVTLSACETALGKINPGDDVVGLTRGFLYAGANSIVASLWKVDDMATSYLMTGFYSNLKKTNKRDALRDAQLTIKKQYEHPYFWAAFQLTGMPD